MDFCFVILHFLTLLAVNAKSYVNSNKKPTLLKKSRVRLFAEKKVGFHKKDRIGAGGEKL